MKKWVVIGVLLLFVLAGLTACNPFGGGDTGQTETQMVSVERGDITVSVTGSGNIANSREARLTFGSGGKIKNINVKEGDKVNKGDVLAKLDISTLELARNQAQLALTQAQVALTQAKLAQKTAEYELKTTEDGKDALELALFQSQIDLRNAEYHLNETRDIYTWPEIKTAQREVDEAEAYLQYALDSGLSETAVTYAQARLTAVEGKLDAMIHTYDTEEAQIAEMQVKAAEMAQAQADNNLANLNNQTDVKELQLEAAKQSVVQAEQSVELAQHSLDDAQRQLDEATITAPFDAIVASVLAKEDDIIPSPTMAPKTIIHLIDPASLELIVEVDEIDIPEVQFNQEAIISVDALPDVTFKGLVTSVFPLPVTEGGVVLYDVKIGIDLPENSKLKVGMSASADIITDKRSNVLLVPSRAIKQDSQGNAVLQVTVNGQIQEKTVAVGLSNDSQTEIVSGLSEGETVVVETRPQSTTDSGQGLFF